MQVRGSERGRYIQEERTTNGRKGKGWFEIIDHPRAGGAVVIEKHKRRARSGDLCGRCFLWAAESTNLVAILEIGAQKETVRPFIVSRAEDES